MNLQILLHIIELGLFVFSLLWVSIRDSQTIQILPFRIMALLTIFLTILGGIALCVYDIVLFFKEMHI